MPLNIKDPETDRLARELSRATGENITQAVKTSLEQRLKRVNKGRRQRSMAEDLMAIGRRCAALPVLDDRTPDEILGYDEHGLPT